MSKTYKASQAFDEGAPIAIELTPFKKYRAETAAA